ncbi:hypothetical protein PAMA_015302 [Pampus argenteus]
MGLLIYCATVLILSARLVFTLPLAEVGRYCKIHNTQCKMCPPGEYQKSCTECKPCPAGSYTTDWNCEKSCFNCFGDCRPDFHLKVIQQCTSTSDLKCICENGFVCSKVPFSENCKFCQVKIQTTTIAVPAAIISDEDKQTASSTSPAPTSLFTKSCQFPKCSTHSVTLQSNHALPQRGESQLAAILYPVIATVCVAIVILSCVRHPREETCFKRAIAKLCKVGRDASRKSKESNHQFPRGSFSAKQQPSSLSEANLGTDE